MDIIIPVWKKAIPEDFYKTVRSVAENTYDFNLIISCSSKTQPVNINRGLERAKGEYIAILDWDVIVPPKWLANLKRKLEEDPSIGIIGPNMKANWWDSKDQIPSGISEHRSIAAGCMVFRNMGFRWDERYISGHWADTDFCRQYLNAGLKVCINGDIEVGHTTVSSETMDTKTPYNENYHKYIGKWGSL